MAQFFPNLVAEGTIGPGRFVIPGTATFTGIQGTAASTLVLGVTGLDTRREDSTNHAIAGDQIRLQDNTQVLEITAGGALATGIRCGSDANGQLVAEAAGPVITLNAAGAADDVVKCFWVGD